MRLHDLPKSGGFKRRKRVGRGEGNGRGKTSGKGHKGARARSGYSLRPGFESGHVPLYRKLPKRGFSNVRFSTRYAVVNIGELDGLEGDSIDRDALVAAGLIRRSERLVKVLGEGEVSRALTVSAHRFSGSARAKLEAAGGKAILIEGAAPAGAEAPEAPQAEAPAADGDTGQS